MKNQQAVVSFQLFELELELDAAYDVTRESAGVWPNILFCPFLKQPYIGSTLHCALCLRQGSSRNALPINWVSNHLMPL